MATVNIGNKDDAFYRYKMPKIRAKIEGRGNGIKTVIINMGDIARALNRPTTYPTKYFGCELGAQSIYDEKNDKATVSGKHDEPVLMSILQNGFIKKFVLCGKCENPETVIQIDKHDNITLECKACGNITQVDPREKLCNFIINHPPPGSGKSTSTNSSTSTTSSTTATGPKKAPKSNAGTTATATTSNHEDLASNLKSSLAADDTWSEDVSAEAVEKRRAEEGLSTRISNMTINDKSAAAAASSQQQDSASDEVSPVKLVKDFLEIKPDATDAQIHTLALKIKQDYKLGDKDMVCLLYEGIFDAATVVALSKKRATVFKKYVTNEASSKILLGYIEKSAIESADNMKAVPKILMNFYDADVLSEEVILDWNKKAKSRFVSPDEFKNIKLAAKPFVEWLKNAEEDDDE